MRASRSLPGQISRFCFWLQREAHFWSFNFPLLNPHLGPKMEVPKWSQKWWKKWKIDTKEQKMKKEVWKRWRKVGLSLKKQLAAAAGSCFPLSLFFTWSSITFSHNTTKNRPIFKSTEKPNGKRWILSHQSDEKRLKIVEDDDKIVEKQLAAAVGSCFSQTTVLCINFHKNAKQLPAAGGSCF